MKRAATADEDSDWEDEDTSVAIGEDVGLAAVGTAATAGDGSDGGAQRASVMPQPRQPQPRQLDQARRLDRLATTAVGTNDDEATGGAFGARVPRRLSADGAIAWHRLDYRASYLLKHVDGQRSYREIIGLSGIDAPSTVAIFSDLRRAGYIAES